jgi:hypothetical protein
MSQITYKVVKHDGGWAYEANAAYSQPFPTRDAARTVTVRSWPHCRRSSLCR